MVLGVIERGKKNYYFALKIIQLNGNNLVENYNLYINEAYRFEKYIKIFAST